MTIQLRRRVRALDGALMEIWTAEHAVNGAVLAHGRTREAVLLYLERRVSDAIAKFRADALLMVA
jgi:hypothetical protein